MQLRPRLVEAQAIAGATSPLMHTNLTTTARRVRTAGCRQPARRQSIYSASNTCFAADATIMISRSTSGTRARYGPRSPYIVKKLIGVR